MVKVISVAVPKGGVGKTTTAVNLAASFAVLEKKTLLIDMDTQGACALSLGIPNEEINGDIFNLLSFAKSVEQITHKTSLDYLNFIPAHITSYKAEEKAERLTGNLLLFRNILEQHLHHYEYIILDCPPYLRGMATVGLAASNSVIIPVKEGRLPLQSVRKIFNHIIAIRKELNSKLSVEGILLTQYESNTNSWRITEDKLFSEFGKFIFKTTIPRSSLVAEATHFGTPIVLYKAKSRGAMAYLDLAHEILIRNKTCPVISNEKESVKVYQ